MACLENLARVGVDVCVGGAGGEGGKSRGADAPGKMSEGGYNHGNRKVGNGLGGGEAGIAVDDT